jgi:hypothetical protein
MKMVFITATAVLIAGCASRPLTPELDDVKMSRENPKSTCEEIGRVTGRTMTAKGSSEEALKDMQSDAAAKGANFVRVEQYSGSGTSVTGVAFRCP